MAELLNKVRKWDTTLSLAPSVWEKLARYCMGPARHLGEGPGHLMQFLSLACRISMFEDF